MEPSVPWHALPEFEARVESVVKKVINEQIRRLMVAVWVMTISGFASLIAVGVAWGSLKASVTANAIADEKHHDDSNIHMTDMVKMNVFVTRAEWSTTMGQQLEMLKSFSDTLHRIENRLDLVNSNQAQ